MQENPSIRFSYPLSIALPHALPLPPLTGKLSVNPALPDGVSHAVNRQHVSRNAIVDIVGFRVANDVLESFLHDFRRAIRTKQCKKSCPLRINRHLRWALWGGLIGIASALMLVVLFRYTQNALIFRIFQVADRLGVLIASLATRHVFPGDRIAYQILSAATFFDIVLILVTGLQTAGLGACFSLILRQRTSTDLSDL